MIHHHLSNRVNSLSESATLQMTRRSRELKDAGIDVINLSIGEPDFDTPESVKAAGIDAIQKNITHYPPVAGFNELRKAVFVQQVLNYFGFIILANYRTQISFCS
jgi:aspartate aminotransferase